MNFATATTCRRCGAECVGEPVPARDQAAARSADHRASRRAAWLVSVVVLVVFAWSRSLLLTSAPVDDSQRAVVFRSIQILDRAGFAREASMLRHFANFRATDNWWNVYLGHQDAYAATNFPLGVMTLYPPFFNTAVDDRERAIILLHEAQHLLGSGEEAALTRVWQEKSRLGWTADEYGQTRVWKNTREWTQTNAPSLFTCGPNRLGDCAP